MSNSKKIIVRKGLQYNNLDLPEMESFLGKIICSGESLKNILHEININMKVIFNELDASRKQPYYDYQAGFDKIEDYMCDIQNQLDRIK